MRFTILFVNTRVFSSSHGKAFFSLFHSCIGHWGKVESDVSSERNEKYSERRLKRTSAFCIHESTLDPTPVHLIRTFILSCESQECLSVVVYACAIFSYFENIFAFDVVIFIRLTKKTRNFGFNSIIVKEKRKCFCDDFQRTMHVTHFCFAGIDVRRSVCLYRPAQKK